MADRKKLIEIGIIVIGILVLLVRVFQVTITKKNGESQVTVEVPVNFNLEEAKRTLAGAGGMREKKDYSEKYRQDIFQKPVELMKLERGNLSGGAKETAAAPAEEKLVLEGIMFGASGGNIAIVSGKVVKKGDMLGSAKIEKIEQNKVILLKNGSLQELKR